MNQWTAFHLFQDKTYREWNHENYLIFKAHSLKEREEVGYGNSNNMKLLYRIWNFFLRFDFSDETYKEFKTLAWEDAEHDAYFSLKHLFRFFCFSLLITFRPNVLEDFQEFTILDCRKGRIYGLYMFWTFLKIHEGAHLLRIRPELQEYLDEFKSYRDFREARHREFSELDLKNIEYSKIIMQEHRRKTCCDHTEPLDSHK
ncbi:la-related protein 1-like isoform X2 [Aethina tumida]|uniref:la-related protein 1-like isoform X2 n=1 Tax=Aethina tumida TaxID=116153 RepID=UPI002148F36C|nr:la-related protein 1-like isoform X2 [Aethina tumida]